MGDGDLPRRRLLRLAGVSLISAVGSTGCTGGRPRSTRRPPSGAPAGDGSSTGPSGSTRSTGPSGLSGSSGVLDPASAVDVEILRTASSIEHYAAGVYTEAAGLDVVTSPVVLDTIKRFADHHSEHGSGFEQATVTAGGKAFTEPNPVLSRAAIQALAALRSEADVIRLAFGVERLAAATYLAAIGGFGDRSLNAMVMGVGASEAGHVAVLAMFLSGVIPDSDAAFLPYAISGFEGTDGALATGVGL